MNFRDALSNLSSLIKAPSRAQAAQETRPEPPQLREGMNTPFDTEFNTYKPFENNLGIYRLIREAFPICDQAVEIVTSLIGTPAIKMEQEKLQPMMDDFAKNVRIGSLNDRGLGNYVQQLADGAYHLGGGVGEMRLTASGKLHSLDVSKTDAIKFASVDGEYKYARRSDGLRSEIVQYPELINYLAFRRREGKPQGFSQFYSMPFVTQIMLRMEKAIENFAWRMGDPVFFVLVKGGDDPKATDATVVKSASNLAAKLGEVWKMKRMGLTGDVHGGVTKGGEATITTVGADAKALIIPAHFQVIEEQIVTGTGVPAGLFSLSFTTRESMIEGQVDIFTSKMNSFRDKCEVIVRQIVDYKLLSEGLAGQAYKVVWPPVNLQDDVKTSEARLNNATAREKEITNVVTLVAMGVYTEEQGNEELAVKGMIKATPSKEWWQESVKSALAGKAMRNIFYLKE